ncbi:hypothetical protein ONZ45_g12176 [Pleurotus djamor]|nr:hypothetical protein ONZ45_g12176 [Pleurotus djamor]
MASASAFLQAACYEHQFIRSKDTSLIVERPERLRAVTVGLATVLSRLGGSRSTVKSEDDADLAAAFERINLTDLLNHPAIKFIHGDVEGNKYLENLLSWANDSRTKIVDGQSEIPDGLSQGDRYPLSALFKEHWELYVKPWTQFLVAHLQHNIKRIVIFDIDLHHGNGTQSIVWQINEETHRQTLESEGGAPSTKIGPKVYYGSLHDILSYPSKLTSSFQDGKQVELVQAASVSIHGNLEQHIENVHLEKYTSEDHFWNDLYPNRYRRILHKAKDFLDGTGGPGDDVMIFISCGFDACEHEYTSMSRHDRKVPAGFYHRFTQDVRESSDQYTWGRLISVLEGRYSDRALNNGTLAHLCGLVGDTVKVDERWWSPENLDEIEKATKKKRGGRPSLSTPSSPWVASLLEHFAALEAEIPQLTRNPRPSVPVATSTRQLRERKPQPVAQANSKSQSPQRKTKDAAVSQSPSVHADTSDKSSLSSLDSAAEDTPPVKKGPRVILRLGPKP